MMKKAFQLFAISVLFSSCLKTRTDVSELDQNEIYAKKNAENQIESQTADLKNELIRNLNGRVEVLELNLASIQGEKEMNTLRDSQRIALLQETVAKLEIQLQKLETKVSENKKINDVLMKSSDDQTEDQEDAPIVKKEKTKKIGPFEQAEDHFKNSEWKKAIISYQKYTEETPKGKFTADAKYKIGLCFQELGMKEEAMAFYEEVVANYSKTEAGKKSKTRLAKLKK